MEATHVTLQHFLFELIRHLFEIEPFVLSLSSELPRHSIHLLVLAEDDDLLEDVEADDKKEEPLQDVSELDSCDRLLLDTSLNL